MSEKKRFTWTEDRVLRFARVASAGPYGRYQGCKTIEQKKKRFKDLEMGVPITNLLPTTKVTIEVDIVTKEGVTEIKKALTKGIAYGLDVMQVASPQNHKIASIKAK